MGLFTDDLLTARVVQLEGQIKALEDAYRKRNDEDFRVGRDTRFDYPWYPDADESLKQEADK